MDITNELMELVFSRTQYGSLLGTMESLDRAFIQHRYHKYRDKLHSNKNSHARSWYVCVWVRVCHHVYYISVYGGVHHLIHMEKHTTYRLQVAVCHHLYTGGAGEEKKEDVVMDTHEKNQVTMSTIHYIGGLYN